MKKRPAQTAGAAHTTYIRKWQDGCRGGRQRGGTAGGPRPRFISSRTARTDKARVDTLSGAFCAHQESPTVRMAPSDSAFVPSFLCFPTDVPPYKDMRKHRSHFTSLSGSVVALVYSKRPSPLRPD
uniref:Uncharacterized protein n=1 Tax=Plectus sambesii TaxID=2011161 RepID=A0A914X538_9BILA